MEEALKKEAEEKARKEAELEAHEKKMLEEVVKKEKTAASLAKKVNETKQTDSLHVKKDASPTPKAAPAAAAAPKPIEQKKPETSAPKAEVKKEDPNHDQMQHVLQVK